MTPADQPSDWHTIEFTLTLVDTTPGDNIQRDVCGVVAGVLVRGTWAQLGEITDEAIAESLAGAARHVGEQLRKKYAHGKKVQR
jgi:hypothetical protein